MEQVQQYTEQGQQLLADTVANLAMLSALDRAEQLKQRGQQIGADLVHDPAFLTNAACTLTDKLWKEDRQGSASQCALHRKQALVIDLTMIAAADHIPRECMDKPLPGARLFK